MILTLLLPEKSVILVGKTLVLVKTALVEGLAYRMQLGDIPEALKKYHIIKMNTTALVGSVEKDGSTDSKMQLLIEELKILIMLFFSLMKSTLL